MSPGVFVSTGVLYSNLVPSGRSPTFPIDFLGSGVSPTLTDCSLGVGVYLSASFGAFVTVNLNVSVTGFPSAPLTGFPSLPKTVTVTSDSPSVVGVPVICFVAGS